MVVVIKVRDNKTGEKFAREIHQDFFTDENVFDSIVSAVEHTRTRNDVERFVKGRTGFPESVKKESEERF